MEVQLRHPFDQLLAACPDCGAGVWSIFPDGELRPKQLRACKQPCRFGPSAWKSGDPLLTINCEEGRHREACAGPPETEEHLVPPCDCRCHDKAVA